MMLNFSDYLALTGPTVTVGIYLLASLRRSRVERATQHEQGQASLRELKDDIMDLRDKFGNRLTAVEVAIEHFVLGKRER